jgi:hypothetical protein
MRIEIGKYIVRSLDQYNFVLEERKQTKKCVVAGKVIEGGQERIETVGYYGRLEMVLKSLLNKHLRDSDDIDTTSKLLNALSRAEERLESTYVIQKD